MDIIKHLPDIYLENLKEKGINYRFNPAQHRYQRSIDVLRKDGTIICTIDPPFYSSNSVFSSTIVRNKMKTENYLKNFNIRTPNSLVYDVNEMELAKKQSFEHMSSVVIKPLDGSLGKGVMVDVSKDRFEVNWKESSKFLAGGRKIIVQEYIEGFEARALVIEGKLVSVVVRTPPFVIGDGMHNIEELINISNEEKKKCGVRKNLLIKKSERLSEYLLSKNINLVSVPSENEYVLLGAVSNVSNGGELINITEFVSDEIKETALNTIGAINGMFTGGVDIMMTNFEDKNPVVIEVNAFPVLSISSFPTYGEVVNAADRYISTIIAIDQFKNDVNDKYDIINAEELVRDYLKFVERKKILFDDLYSKKSRYF